MPRKIFIIACEPSGDTHGSHLVRELKNQGPEIIFRGLGGPKMAAAGVTLLKDMTAFSALGFGDVIRQYGAYRQVFYRALKDVEKFSPDAIILIDSPAFNLRFAKKISAMNLGGPVLYYISPQLWAWGGRRIHTIKKTVSKMLVILPFEKELYEKAGVPCEFVGHPLLDIVHAAEDPKAVRSRLGIAADEKLIGLLPGSRESEVKRILPLMLEAAAEMRPGMPEINFRILSSPNVRREVYEDATQNHPLLEARLLEGNFYDTLAAMDFAFIASGTATTEAALLGVPFFLFYKTSWSTYFLGRSLIRVPFLGLVNLLMERAVVPEFIQRNIHPEKIARQAHDFLEDKGLYEKMKNDFKEAGKKLGSPGASRRAASAVTEFLDRRQGVVHRTPPGQKGQTLRV